MAAGPGAHDDVDVAIERVWREHWGRLVALLLGQSGRPDLAEDAVADAFAAATRTAVASPEAGLSSADITM